MVGVGGVGEAIAALAKPRTWIKQLVLADYDLGRAKDVRKKLGGTKRFPAEKVDASDRAAVIALARKYDADLIMNAVDPLFNEAIFDAAFEAGTNYMDMAMSLSSPHPIKPHEKTGIKLGDYQFDLASELVRKVFVSLL
jgi:saccharopine dehydrogenase-like NADP-dependent oxidoreductase